MFGRWTSDTKLGVYAAPVACVNMPAKPPMKDSEVMKDKVLSALIQKKNLYIYIYITKNLWLNRSPWLNALFYSAQKQCGMLVTKSFIILCKDFCAYNKYIYL